MMTPIEAILAQMKWVYKDGQFTTVRNGFGFILYRKDNQMWLGGLSQSSTTLAQKTHNNGPFEVTAFWGGCWKSTPMFVIPATSDFVSAVVTSTYPELA